MLQDLLDTDFLLDRAFRVRMLFQIDHLHRDGLTRLAVDEQFHSVGTNIHTPPQQHNAGGCGRGDDGDTVWFAHVCMCVCLYVRASVEI